MAAVEIPEDFIAEFTREYTLYGRTFTIEVQYRGIFIPDGLSESYHFWWFKLIYQDVVTVAGPFKHKCSDEEQLVKSSVANNLASFFGSGDLDALKETALLEAASREALEDTIDEIAMRCANYALMNLSDAFITMRGLSDYDILLKHKDGNGWDVVLMLHCEPSRLYHFSKLLDGKVNITTYTKAHKVQIDSI